MRNCHFYVICDASQVRFVRPYCDTSAQESPSTEGPVIVDSFEARPWRLMCKGGT